MLWLWWALRRLESSVPSERYAAVQKLGRCRNARAIAALTSLLKDKTEEIRREAATALEQLGWEPLTSEDHVWFAVAKEEWAKVSAEGAAAVQPLAIMVTASKPTQSGNVPKQSVGHRIGHRRSSPHRKSPTQLNARNALAAIRDPGAVDLLASLMMTGDACLYEPASEALVGIGGADATDALVSGLEHPSVGVRQSAARALGRVKSKEAVIPLTRLLKDSSGDVRSVAAEALGEIKDPAAVGCLMERLNDGNSVVVLAVVRALCSIGDPRALESMVQVLEVHHYVGKQVRPRELAAFRHPSLVPWLIKCLHNNATTREAVESLAVIRDISSVEALAQVHGAYQGFRNVGRNCLGISWKRRLACYQCSQDSN